MPTADQVDCTGQVADRTAAVAVDSRREEDPFGNQHVVCKEERRRLGPSRETARGMPPDAVRARQPGTPGLGSTSRQR